MIVPAPTSTSQPASLSQSSCASAVGSFSTTTSSELSTSTSTCLSDLKSIPISTASNPKPASTPNEESKGELLLGGKTWTEWIVAGIVPELVKDWTSGLDKEELRRAKMEKEKERGKGWDLDWSGGLPW
jgi:hypothetical protein